MRFQRNLIKLFIISTTVLLFTGCNRVLLWPDPPVYPKPAPVLDYIQPKSKSELIKNITGHYAHYDVVSYEDNSGRETVRSFIITYGFTDFYADDGELFEKDIFLHAENKINQSSVSSEFSDTATQAIKSRESKVDISYVNNHWYLFRPSTPTLIGIQGDDKKPIETNGNPDRFTDPDMDGKPGVTVKITIFGVIQAELYIARREIFEYYLEIIDSDTIYGNVVDKSEQYIIGATMKELTESTNPIQHPDKNMSLILLKRIPDEIDTWEELKSMRNDLFPPEPDFR